MLTLDGEGSGGRISDNDKDEDDFGQDIDGDNLGRIQQLYGDFQPMKHDDINDLANDSDAEPIQESTNSPPDAKAYKTDQIRQLPAGYQAGQPLRDFPFSAQ
ncbi:hypothetical protein BGX38DRAFT_1280800 [Terfezia claveryi]|nr:hypothetical protein BGX38DRAFT_1280800 [Terfezia claveryi]